MSARPWATRLHVHLHQLDRLPLELLIKVLLQLDIPSLTRFRCLNRRAMALVNSVHEALTSSAPLSASRRTHLTAILCTERSVQAGVSRAIALETISIL